MRGPIFSLPIFLMILVMASPVGAQGDPEEFYLDFQIGKIEVDRGWDYWMASVDDGGFGEPVAPDFPQGGPIPPGTCGAYVYVEDWVWYGPDALVEHLPDSELLEELPRPVRMKVGLPFAGCDPLRSFYFEGPLTPEIWHGWLPCYGGFYGGCPTGLYLRVTIDEFLTEVGTPVEPPEDPWGDPGFPGSEDFCEDYPDLCEFHLGDVCDLGPLMDECKETLAVQDMIAVSSRALFEPARGTHFSRSVLASGGLEATERAAAALLAADRRVAAAERSLEDALDTNRRLAFSVAERSSGPITSHALSTTSMELDSGVASVKECRRQLAVARRAVRAEELRSTAALDEVDRSCYLAYFHLNRATQALSTLRNIAFEFEGERDWSEFSLGVFAGLYDDDSDGQGSLFGMRASYRATQRLGFEVSVDRSEPDEGAAGERVSVDGSLVVFTPRSDRWSLVVGPGWSELSDSGSGSTGDLTAHFGLATRARLSRSVDWRSDLRLRYIDADPSQVQALLTVGLRFDL